MGEAEGFGLAPGTGVTFGGVGGEGDCKIPFCSRVLKRVINPIAPSESVLALIPYREYRLTLFGWNILPP